MTVMKAPTPASPLVPQARLEAAPIAADIGPVDPTAYFEHLEGLGEIGKQHARAGEEFAALMVRDQVRHPNYTDPADEITLAVMDLQLTRGDVKAGSATMREVSENMAAWGVLKLLKHGVRPQDWQTLRYPLENTWGQYNLRQQGEIIDDLLAIGEYRCAVHFANLMAPADSVPEERQVRRETIIGIARHQADYGDPQGGINTLAQLQVEAEEALGNVIVERMDVPEYPSTREEAAALYDINARHHEYTEALNAAEMHIIALRAHQSVGLAHNLLARAAFFADDHRETHALARQVLNTTIADMNLYEPAPRVTGLAEPTPVERNILSRGGSMAMNGLRRVVSRLRRYQRP
ncbi:MAG TPA: hypothetical protein VLF62_04495 [Candidatus Saccharimonadales bacterium]|nr:hypothetical protein [Candidatus Saccharimonadales bacterium]